MSEKINYIGRDEANGRRVYLGRLFLIFIFLPICIEILGNAIGFDFGTFSKIVKVDSAGDNIGTGFRMNIMSAWYLSLPLFIYFTYKRVSDTSLSPWLTVIFLLPVINIVIWFLPPRKNEMLAGIDGASLEDLNTELESERAKESPDFRLKIEHEIEVRELEGDFNEPELPIKKPKAKVLTIIFVLAVVVVGLIVIFYDELGEHVYPNNYKLTLSTGETITVEKFIEMYAGGDDTWMLAIQYSANDLSDLSYLCKNARLIWPHLKPHVEKKGWDWGTIKAAKRVVIEDDGLVTKTGIKAYSISFHRVGEEWKISSEADVCGK
ncbi:MAG: hypothetical protein ACI978_001135 [Oleispira sp.]